MYFTRIRAVNTQIAYPLKSLLLTKWPISHKLKIIVAFTLAEVLITLLIIGVVASLVIPALVQDSQNAELKTALKSFYSNISNATKLIAAENGGTVKGLLSDGNVLRNLYAEKMNFIKKCNSNETPGNCWHQSIIGVVRQYNGNNRSDYNNPFPGIIFTNGGFLIIKGTMPDCNGQYSGLIAPVSCALIRADINGFKGPNIHGKDIFDFHVLQTTVSPRGGSMDSIHSCSGDGDYCAGVILGNV